jgi:hypothetical protein
MEIHCDLIIICPRNKEAINVMDDCHGCRYYKGAHDCSIECSFK